MDTSRNESTSPTLFTYSNSQSQQPDISQDFHRCIVKVADGLNDEVTKEKIRYLYKPQLGSGEYRTALSMLDKLQEKGVFSERNVEPLKTLLKDCDRHDLLTQFVNEYRKTDVYAASAMQADPETEDCPSQSKRARLATEEMKEFDVSEVKECNSASIHGVIVRVSQLHKTRNSSAKYFTAEVTDGKKTLKFICHDPPFRDPIVELKEKKVAVTIKDCRIMQSTYPTSKGKFELHCNPGTKILENPQKEFDIRSDTVYTHGTILSKLEAMQDTVRKQVVTVCGKIVDVKSCCEVTRKSDLVTLKMQECILADSSMMVKLNIWEGDIDKVVKGSSYQFINVKVKEYDGERYLSTNEDSEINKIEDIPGTLSTKIMPSGLTKIPGEISAVQSVFKYKKCTSQACSGKVKEVNTTIGECNKCRRSVKLKLCADSVCVKFTIQGQNDTCYDVTAFEQVVNLIIGNNFSCTAPDSETDKIEHLLFKASPATFFLNHEDVVIKVERED